jgi:hypothetical protein
MHHFIAPWCCRNKNDMGRGERSMSDSKELDELRSQIKHLNEIVTRLEQGETKYERPELVLRKKRSEIYDKYYAKTEDQREIHTYWRQRECYINSLSKVVNQIFKNRKNTTRDIRAVITTSEDIQEYCLIYEQFLKLIKEQEDVNEQTSE